MKTDKVKYEVECLLLVISYGKKVETEIASYVFVTSTMDFFILGIML